MKELNLMDVNLMRIAITVLSLFLFLGIVAWAWARRRQPDFEAAAQLPFGDGGGDNAAPEAVTTEAVTTNAVTPVGGGQR